MLVVLAMGVVVTNDPAVVALAYLVVDVRKVVAHHPSILVNSHFPAEDAVAAPLR